MVTRLRHLKACRPERWGEAMTVRNVEIDNLDPSQLDDAEFERSIAETEYKFSIVRGMAGHDIGSQVGALPENVEQLRRRAVRDLF
jgi:hypothetical protein